MSHAISRRPCVERVAYILGRCAGKRVLHVGCTSFPNTVAKIRSGTLLHAQLQRVAALVHGIDVDEEGLRTLRAEGFDGVLQVDARRLGDPQPGLLDSYDVVLLADVIEHVEEPRAVLLGSRSRLAPDGEILVTTVNAFYLYGTLRVMLGSEVTHPEHVASYTQSNLRELMRRLDLEVRDLRGYYEPFAHRGPLVRAFKLLEAAVLRVFPGISAGILCAASPAAAARRAGA
ncbi:MAG: class I SAM-dependent methyltransferase [Candidatus Limnocylindria bacterium]